MSKVVFYEHNDWYRAQVDEQTYDVILVPERTAQEVAYIKAGTNVCPFCKSADIGVIGESSVAHSGCIGLGADITETFMYICYDCAKIWVDKTVITGFEEAEI